MKKSLVLISLLLVVNLIAWDFYGLREKEKKELMKKAKQGSLAFPKEYWFFKLKLHGYKLSGEVYRRFSKATLKDRETEGFYLTNVVPVIDVAERTFNEVKDTFKENTKKEAEIYREIAYPNDYIMHLLPIYIGKGYPNAKEYLKTIQKMEEREREREREREIAYRWEYGKEIAKEVYKLNWRGDVIFQKKQIEKIFKKKVYPLVIYAYYINSLTHIGKLIEAKKFYQKYKDKITDKEWMRSRICVGWINYSLKNLYDALHKEYSKKYPTGDEMVKEVDDKIASLEKKGMKFWSKWN